jgi:hypothetical protein
MGAAPGLIFLSLAKMLAGANAFEISDIVQRCSLTFQRVRVPPVV